MFGANVQSVAIGGALYAVGTASGLLVTAR
jgi:hypothetical protein